MAPKRLLTSKATAAAISAAASSKKSRSACAAATKQKKTVDVVADAAGSAASASLVPSFTLPSSILNHKRQFFNTVFEWYSQRHNANEDGSSRNPAASEELLVQPPATKRLRSEGKGGSGEAGAGAGGSSTADALTSSLPSSSAVLSIPWRSPPYNKDPYAIWVSEVMSQQTQLATVVRYWTAWMSTFPTVEALAAASGEQVRAVWAGMGYYRRADFLHKGAQYIVNEWRGLTKTTTAAATTVPRKGKVEVKHSDTEEGSSSPLFPTACAEWVKLVPGAGPYTAAAITSICFNAPATAVDGNVMRVMSRLMGAKGVDPKNTKHIALLQQALNAGLLPAKGQRSKQQQHQQQQPQQSITNVDDDGGDDASFSDDSSIVEVPIPPTSASSPQQRQSQGVPFLSDCPPDIRGRVNEGLMEIGASICKPNQAPLCHLCPFSKPLAIASSSSSLSSATSPQQRRFCTAYSMLLDKDIEAIDGIIPMRGTAAKVRGENIETLIVFVKEEEGNAPTAKDEKEAVVKPTLRGAKKEKKIIKLEDEAGEDDDNPTSSSHDNNCSKLSRLRERVRGYSVFCMTRPKGGLLSEMTDFPSRGEQNESDEEGEAKAAVKKRRQPSSAAASTSFSSCLSLGSFLHVFSHIRMTVNVKAVVVENEAEGKEALLRWRKEGAAAAGVKDDGAAAKEEEVFSVPLNRLSSYPLSQLALKGLQCALPLLFAPADPSSSSKTKASGSAKNNNKATAVGGAAAVSASSLSSAEARQLAHALCNRRVSGGGEKAAASSATK